MNVNYQIIINPPTSSITVISNTQHIIVNPVTSAASVINNGPMGPRGLTGPPDASNILTVDGQIMTRTLGGLAPISRVNLAADPAFTAAMTAHIAASDPHPIYLTAAEGNAAYINASGDTMTGVLNLSSGGEALKLNGGDGQYIGFWNSGTRHGYIQSNPTYLTINGDSGTAQLQSGSYYLTINPGGTNQMVGHLGMNNYSVNNIEGGLRVGNSIKHGASWAGLHWGDGDYIIMSNATQTLVSARGGSVELRSGTNGSGLVLNADGNHSLWGNLNHTGFNVTGIARLEASNVYFNGADTNHYIGYHGTVNGPIINGWSGGGLYSSAVNNWALTWNGINVTIGGILTVAGINSSGHINGNYINMTAEVLGGWPAYIAGQNGDNFMRWYNKSGQFTSTGLVSNRFGQTWDSAGVTVGTSAGSGCYTVHTGNFAPTMLATEATGNTWYFRDAGSNAGTTACVAGAWNIESSRRWKKNITSWPLKNAGAAVESATDYLAKLRPVTFQVANKLTVTPSLRRAQAYGRLNAHNKRMGRPLYELPEHDCDVVNCTGTRDQPCMPKEWHDRQRFGFIAEEVAEVLPSMVHNDAEHLPEAIDTMQMLAVTVATVQDLIERIKVLEGSTT